MRRPRAALPGRGVLRSLALLVFIALLVGAAQAQVAFDAVNIGGAQTGLTWTHTVGASATNVVLLVGVSLNGTVQVSNVTWSGTSPTFSCLFAEGVDGSGNAQGSCGNDGSSPSRRVEIWGAVLGTPAANKKRHDHGYAVGQHVDSFR